MWHERSFGNYESTYNYVCTYAQICSDIHTFLWGDTVLAVSLRVGRGVQDGNKVTVKSSLYIALKGAHLCAS